MTVSVQGSAHIIYADPGWAYRNIRTGGGHISGSGQKYDVMDPAEVGRLPVASICAPDAALFLWATVPLLDEILPIVRRWGFRYTSCLFWRKTGRLGLGYWYRNHVEVLIFGTRGKVPAWRSPYPNVVEAPVTGHSHKPLAFRQLIEDTAGRYWPTGPWIELFARLPCERWTCVGMDLGWDLRKPSAWEYLRQTKEKT